jgi:hypothetical protein
MDEKMVRSILGRQLGRSRSEDYEDALCQLQLLHWKLWTEDPEGSRPRGYRAVAIKNKAAAIGEQLRNRAARESAQAAELIAERREAETEGWERSDQIAADDAATEILEQIADRFGLVYLGITVARMQGCTFTEVGARYGHTAGWARRRWFFLRHKLREEFAHFESGF